MEDSEILFNKKFKEILELDKNIWNQGLKQIKRSKN